MKRACARRYARTRSRIVDGHVVSRVASEPSGSGRAVLADGCGGSRLTRAKGRPALFEDESGYSKADQGSREPLRVSKWWGLPTNLASGTGQLRPEIGLSQGFDAGDSPASGQRKRQLGTGRRHGPAHADLRSRAWIRSEERSTVVVPAVEGPRSYRGEFRSRRSNAIRCFKSGTGPARAAVLGRDDREAHIELPGEFLAHFASHLVRARTDARRRLD